MVKGIAMTADYTKTDGRRQRSRVTRVRVIDAAAGLFLERGYVAATIEDVAERAAVAVQTVYYVFGTKPKLLSAVLDASIAGDVEPVPLLERPWVGALREQHDVGSAMERLVDDSVTILSRASPLYEVVRRAAADPEVNQLLQETRRRRRSDQRALIEILSSAGRLRPDLDADTAADVFYGLINEEVFQLFVRDCGWDVERLKRWATSLMMQQLIGEGE
jgi:AcrR family transcriptional regulator